MTEICRHFQRVANVLRWLLINWVGLCGVSISSPAVAHPHIWVTYDLTLQIAGTTVVALREKWRFGPEFPLSSLVKAGDIPANGAFSSKVTESLRQQAFSSLSSDGFFTHAFVNGLLVKFSAPEQFQAAMEGGRLTYTFLMKPAVPIDVSHAQVVVGVWDDSFFVDATPDAVNGIRFVVGSGRSCRAATFRDSTHAIYGGTVYPVAIRITCQGNS